MWQLSNSWPNQFQNNLTWPSHTAGISLDSRLEHSKITSPDCDLYATVFWWVSCTSARHAGSFDCLMTSLILITMAEGTVHTGGPAKFPTKPIEEWQKLGKCMLWNKLRSVQNTGTCYPGLGWICQVHLGFGLSASAQVPDKPALARVACPGILHRS